jgi:tetratricopeptide (TPR) repeat protein
MIWPLHLLVIGCLSTSLIASTANAEWLEASSDHFVIYADQRERELTGFAERLELFHAAMAYRFRMQQAKPSPSNRLTIYVVSNPAKIRELVQGNNRYLAGVYLPRAGSAIAVIPKLDRVSSQYELSPETILYHEYAHHFMAGLTARAFPRWFVEGFAEFFASVRFEPDGGVGLGAPAYHRAAELMDARDVPIRRMLDFDGGAGASKSVYDAFYGQSWLLFHYLQFAPERAGQLAQYQSLLAKGEPALDAAAGAFGDLDQLEKDLVSYQKRKKLSYLIIAGKALKIGPITVRALRPGEAAMIPTTIRSKIGVTHEEALKLLPEAQRIAGLHPDDPAVLAALAEAEFNAGNDDAAIAAADGALTIDPNLINAHIQKGYSLFRKVQTGALPKESWKDVRSQFVRANKIEIDNPIPLIQYYLTFKENGEPPTKTAVDGIEWAMMLAPFDSSLRWLAAQQMISENRLKDAAQTLVPLAYSPHPGEHTERARQLLKDVQARIRSDQGLPTN